MLKTFERASGDGVGGERDDNTTEHETIRNFNLKYIYAVYFEGLNT